MCRFHLDLQRVHAQPDANVSQRLHATSIGSFRAVSHRMHAVMTEFGDSLVDGNAEVEAARDEIELEEFQFRPQSAKRTPRSVSLVHMWIRLADNFQGG